MVLEALWLRTGRQVYLDVFQYWLKIFAISFAMGVVSGLVMSYEFGTNWAVFADKAGPIVGPLMGYEVLTAFFLEAGFLGVMLFGMNARAARLHFIATCLVAARHADERVLDPVGEFLDADAAGFTRDADGRFIPADWWAIIFNPSFPYRLVHMVIASYLTVAFVVGAVGAFHLLRDRQNVAARTMFSMAMWMAAIVAPLQLFAGDQHGLNTLATPAGEDRRARGRFRDRRPGSR